MRHIPYAFVLATAVASAAFLAMMPVFLDRYGLAAFEAHPNSGVLSQVSDLNYTRGAPVDYADAVRDCTVAGTMDAACVENEVYLRLRFPSVTRYKTIEWLLPRDDMLPTPNVTTPRSHLPARGYAVSLASPPPAGYESDARPPCWVLWA